jgi:hypothetical protein
MSMEMVERRTKNEEANAKNMPQGERNSRDFSNKIKDGGYCTFYYRN